MPTLLAQISDPHIRLGELGPQAAAALARAVQAVRELPSPPDAVLVTGDLADGGDPREYAETRELLAPFEVPVHVLPGNHDEAGAFTDAFGATAWTAQVKGLRLVGCDTSRPGRDDGKLDLDWLAGRLAENRATPTIVAKPHPPLLTGLGALDAIGIPDDQRTALAGVLQRAPNVLRVVGGHVHRTAVDALGGCGVVACTSTNAQSRLEIGSTEFDLSPEEPPAFLLHVLLDSGELVTHVQPISR